MLAVNYIRNFTKANTFQQIIVRYKSTNAQHTMTNPGVNLRKRLFNENELNDIDSADIEDLEADFMDVHKSHKYFESEVKLMKEKQKLYVRKKYFKQNAVNFLTWSDKEQIRHLYITNPQEWTIEKLSESFPALPKVIAAIATSNWKKNDAKIQSHDRAVEKNWILFKEGKLNLPPQLAVHLSKFSDRSINLKSIQKPLKNMSTTHLNIKQQSSKFSDIIASYENLLNKDKCRQIGDEEQITFNLNNLSKQPKKETYIKEKSSKQNVTFKELQKCLKTDASEGKLLDEEEKRILKESNEYKEKQLQIIELKVEDLDIDKFSKTSPLNITSKPKDYSYLIYPQYITIPKQVYRRDHVYKLNDCFYNDKGYFLYRVPGMEK